MKKTALLVLLLVSMTFLASGYKHTETYTIDAVPNAYEHNNIALNYMEEKCYYAAIQEYKIAISLSPNVQATSVFYNNLGEAYMIIGYPDYAQDCFERAIKQYPLNFKYHVNLARCYQARGIVPLKIQEYKADTENPLNQIMVGLLYAENNEVPRAITTLDEFVMLEPDLMITPAVSQHVKDLVKKMNEEAI